MTAEVFSLPRTTSPAPLVPAGIDVRSADIMASDLKYLQKRSALMTAEHFGVWSRLQMASHLEQVTGTLPNNDKALAVAAGFTIEGIDRWLAMKDEVLEDWILCADDRWHHPSRARNVLHIWIGGRERDRRSTLGNKSKSAKARACLAALEDAIEFGRDALARIDPQDRFLLGLDERISRWPSKADAAEAAEPVIAVEKPTRPTPSSASYYDSDDPDYVRNTTVSATINETKRSEVKRTDSSSLLRRDDSSDRQAKPKREFGLEGGSSERTASGPAKRERAPPWPSDWFEVFQAKFPKREAWGRAEKVLERIRKAGKIPFEDVMAGVDRLVARIASGQEQVRFVPQPAKWLDGRGWEDEPDTRPVIIGNAEILPPARGSPGPSPSRPIGNPRAACATRIIEALNDATR